MAYSTSICGQTFQFKSLKALLAKASPARSADDLAQIAALDQRERIAAQMCLANLPLTQFLNESVISPQIDDVSRLIENQFDHHAFRRIAHHTVGSFRDWLLLYSTQKEDLRAITWGLTPEMVAAVSKIMRNQDLITVAKKCEVITKFRSTIGLQGHLAVRLQPNHPTDDPQGIAASIMDGLRLGAGDAVIGINPASDSIDNAHALLNLTENIRTHHDIPTQSCVLTHVTNQIELMKQKAPVDLVFQSIGGTQATNASFGVELSMLKDSRAMALDLKRNGSEFVMYFETGQGSALSAGSHHSVDAQTLEARAYAVAREFKPFLVNSVVGFIGPEYLFDGKQIIRAGLEDHFCGKLLGLPMGVDICYTNHAQADQHDMDVLLTLLGVAGCNFIMGVPGSDDVMLNYQSTSFHDALYLRSVLGLKPAPEFFDWLRTREIMSANAQLLFDQRGLLKTNN